MTSPRVVIVHTRDHVNAARKAAHQTNTPVMLLSAPHIATAGGPLYAKAMMGDATSLVIPILDCGDDPGILWRAADVGWTTLLFWGSDALLEKARSAFQHKDPSFPRKRESSPSKTLDARFRGDDKESSATLLTPSDLPSAILDLGQTTRKGDVLVEYVIAWLR